MQQLRQGSLLQGGKYRIEKVLGQGGFGITYLAVQDLLDRKVCIKEFFYKEYCERNEETSHVTLGTQSNHELVERFLNKFLKEARTISQLDHPNIIHIHDIFKENNTAYYVMDYIEGESLAEKVKNEGVLPETIATNYIKQVASALEFIHKQSINHLDVKPANIMVRKADNRAILIDFGLSKQYDEQGGQTSTTPVGISHGYAPMEQYNAGGVSMFSPQTDIYSLGATLYKLVTGITPPQASDVLNDGLPELPNHLLDSVKNAITQSMQVRKKDRPADINSFLSFLNGNSFNPEKNTNHTNSKTFIINEADGDEETKVISATPTNEVKKIEEHNITQHDDEDCGDKKNKHKSWKKYLWIIGIAIALSFIVYEYGQNENYNTTQTQKSDTSYWEALDTVVVVDTVLVGDTVAVDSIVEPTDEELLEQALSYNDQRQYQKAFVIFEKLAYKGYAEAQYQLGVKYNKLLQGSNGKKADEHRNNMKLWWSRSAEQGHVKALYEMALLYETTEINKCIEYLKIASDKGDLKSTCYLGSVYERRTNLLSEAISYYSKAAELGYAEAEYRLGVCYFYGKGVNEDINECIVWYTKAAQKGHGYAQYQLASCYYYGYQGLNINYAIAAKWWEKSAKTDIPPAVREQALKEAARCYIKGGYGLSKDLNKATMLLKGAGMSANEISEFITKN